MRVFSLGRRWRRFWRRLGSSWDFRAELGALDRRYGEPHRFYHNWDHIRRCLAELDRARSLAAEPDALELALWYHDAVYDPKASDNEVRSAFLAVKAARAAGLSETFARAVSVLVLSTRVDGPDAEGNARADGNTRAERSAPVDEPGADPTRVPGPPAARDVALIRDIDLSVLGLPRPAYRRYELAIRREYSWVPAEQFRRRRGALLRGFLGRETVYATDRFRSLYERRARSNLRWALRRLEEGRLRGGRRHPGARAGSGSR
jgi:predicted metal-dependent HD superfamily phosphohydrolase